MARTKLQLSLLVGGLLALACGAAPGAEPDEYGTQYDGLKQLEPATSYDDAIAITKPTQPEPTPPIVVLDPGDKDPVYIVDPTPVDDDELLGIVTVRGMSGTCTGSLIADDRVITAAHCFCTWDYVGGNKCDLNAEVVFRDNPAAPTSESLRTMVGVATISPDYNPTWTDREIEGDIAVIDLISTAPEYVTRYEVAGEKLATGTTVKLVGFGHTGSGCSGPAGSLNFKEVSIDEYVDGGRIIQFNDQEDCAGDSGGPVMNLAGTRIYGVHSGHWWTLQHWIVSKSIHVVPYFDWIHDLSCATDLWNACSDKGPICRCGSGNGDCDFDYECLDGLGCRHDVGGSIGVGSLVDICLPPGPVEGTCGCGNSGVGNICTPHYDGCNPGFNPVCTPGQYNCGVCVCQ
jgi:hypothetical protein